MIGQMIAARHRAGRERHGVIFIDAATRGENRHLPDIRASLADFMFIACGRLSLFISALSNCRAYRRLISRRRDAIYLRH